MNGLNLLSKLRQLLYTLIDANSTTEIIDIVTETVLGIFGFDRTLFGKAKDKKWRLELRRNSMNDVQAEVGGR